MKDGRRGRVVAGLVLLLSSVAGLWWTYGIHGICGTRVLFLFFLPFGFLGIVLGALLQLD